MKAIVNWGRPRVSRFGENTSLAKVPERIQWAIVVLTFESLKLKANK